ncbi:DMT family transporter [Actinospica robiniae]|uniref:DMT family transporter n=1 Tax=Actinospica robiniae TaxID=304901 RepID=UPI0003F697F7|nr:DMT family transporter [Actinospica robiniae]
MNALTVLMALLSAMSNAAATVLQRRASVGLAPLAGTGARVWTARLLQPLRRVGWWIGVSAIGVSAICQVVALDSGRLSVVQPLLATELLFTLLLGALVFRCWPSPALWRAFLMLAVGLALFLLAASPSGGGNEASGARWLAVGGGLAGLVVVLVLVALHLHGLARAAVLGTATAACFSATAGLIKEVTGRFPDGAGAVLTTWFTYAAALAGLISLLLLQWTLRAGSLTGSQPALTLGDALISVALGSLLFGERIALGWHVTVEVLGVALMAVGVLGLTGVHHTLAGSAEWDENTPVPDGNA